MKLKIFIFNKIDRKIQIVAYAYRKLWCEEKLLRKRLHVSVFWKKSRLCPLFTQSIIYSHKWNSQPWLWHIFSAQVFLGKTEYPLVKFWNFFTFSYMDLLSHNTFILHCYLVFGFKVLFSFNPVANIYKINLR